MTYPQEPRPWVVAEILSGTRFGWDSTRAEKVEAVRQMLNSRVKWTAKQLARRIGVTERSAYRYMKQVKEEDSR